MWYFSSHCCENFHFGHKLYSIVSPQWLNIVNSWLTIELGGNCSIDTLLKILYNYKKLNIGMYNFILIVAEM